MLKINDIITALRKLGVAEGDLLLVHASTSRCGKIDGGAETIIQSILTIVGSGGTVLFPTFNYCFERFGDTIVTSGKYKPYDVSDIDGIWTGAVPKTFLRLHPDAYRSKHITHSWAGLGPLAEECTRYQGACAPPCSINSPMGKALEYSGKILYFGCGLAPTTFLHYLEDYADVPFLGPAVCTVKNPDGTLQSLTVEKHLPGHRDFYCPDVENCKFFKAAVENGLHIHENELGTGKLFLIDLQELFTIGMKIMKADPFITLCDLPTCAFCQQMKKDSQK